MILGAACLASTLPRANSVVSPSTPSSGTSTIRTRANGLRITAAMTTGAIRAAPREAPVLSEGQQELRRSHPCVFLWEQPATTRETAVAPSERFLVSFGNRQGKWNPRPLFSLCSFDDECVSLYTLDRQWHAPFFLPLRKLHYFFPCV